MSAITLLQLALAGVEGAVRIFRSIQAAARQSSALTPEQDAAFDAKIESILKSDPWKTDAQRAAEGNPRL